WARIWKAEVGRTTLVLLDTDDPENAPRDRKITQGLYAVEHDIRIRQQIVLGVGGVQALEALKLTPTVYHLNEGHAAFCQLMRLRRAQRRGMPREAVFNSARQNYGVT